MTWFHQTKITKFLKILDISKHVLTPLVHTHHTYLQQTTNFMSKIFLLKFMTFHYLKYLFFTGFD